MLTLQRFVYNLTITTILLLFVAVSSTNSLDNNNNQDSVQIKDDDINNDDEIAAVLTTQDLNIYGEPLQPCSSSGMALTGFTRTGYCSINPNDEGSHHICLNLNATLYQNQNFCQLTHQPNWCSSNTMPCHYPYPLRPKSVSATPSCYIQNWCICRWAFVRLISRRYSSSNDNDGKWDGCRTVIPENGIICEAVNQVVLEAYRKKFSKLKDSEYNEYRYAYECLVERCQLLNHSKSGSSSNMESNTKTSASTTTLNDNTTDKMEETNTSSSEGIVQVDVNGDMYYVLENGTAVPK